MRTNMFDKAALRMAQTVKKESRTTTYVVITYYADGTEQVQDCRDKESAEVDYLLQKDAMKSTPGHIERVRLAQITKDSE